MLYYIFKPLTMVLIILLPVLSNREPLLYWIFITAGLGCSLVGDIFLLLPADRFLAGIIAFGFAHLFYIAGYLSEINSLSWLPLVPLILAGILFILTMSPKLGDFKIPVFLYMAVILFMVWMAWVRWIQLNESGALAALIGAGLFAVSDTVLAVERFKCAFRPAQAVILGTYFTGQLLIAFSAVI